MKTTPLFPSLIVSIIAFAMGCQSCGGSGSHPTSEPAAPDDGTPTAPSALATTAPDAIETSASTCDEQASELRTLGNEFASLGVAFEAPQGFNALNLASGEHMGTQAVYALSKDTVWTAGSDDGGMTLDAAERVFRAKMDVFKTVNRGRPAHRGTVPVTVFDATTPWSVVARWIGVMNSEFDQVALGYLDGRPEVQLGGVPRVAEPASRVVREHKASATPFLSLPMFQSCQDDANDGAPTGELEPPTSNAYSTDGRAAMVEEAVARFRGCDCKVPRGAFEEGLWLDLHGPGLILTVENVALGDAKAPGTTVVSAKATTPWSEMSPRVLAAKAPIAVSVTP